MENPEFALVGMQTDDTVGVSDASFSEQEDAELAKAGLLAKAKVTLTPDHCTESYSLYECLVKLGITQEKKLIINIMALQQSYKRRKLF
ncbi:hypothetical protein CSUB01_12551 [Colletotrichum sublineola]|uniref:Uncharacterized protein n=1 Tax=Colletotrichum sublineola TaxID=1173701 RepID=A0A066X658_COLSU|nr:hypothetical protein CSUB01_12551 [Colletotrichum sublineola]